MEEMRKKSTDEDENRKKIAQEHKDALDEMKQKFEQEKKTIEQRKKQNVLSHQKMMNQKELDEQKKMLENEKQLFEEEEQQIKEQIEKNSRFEYSTDANIYKNTNLKTFYTEYMQKKYKNSEMQQPVRNTKTVVIGREVDSSELEENNIFVCNTEHVVVGENEIMAQKINECSNEQKGEEVLCKECKVGEEQNIQIEGDICNECQNEQNVICNECKNEQKEICNECKEENKDICNECKGEKIEICNECKEEKKDICGECKEENKVLCGECKNENVKIEENICPECEHQDVCCDVENKNQNLCEKCGREKRILVEK